MLQFIFRLLLLVGIRILGGICSLISVANHFKKPIRCPEIKNNVLLYSARSLAEMIRKKEITSEYVVNAYITRIKEVNPILNAVVEERFELAINEAKFVDQMINSTNLSFSELETRYPLLGLPMTVKESIAVEGLSHCAGLLPETIEKRKAMSDANVVKLCKYAGAIPLLVSNTPELSANFETYNKITGTTCNPYDSRRTPGGSSGGEAALLGAGASVIGIGSDIFGSLRLPASFCGIWGHKPTATAVSIQGHYPSSKDQEKWKEIFNIGPLARYSEDLRLLLNVILEKEFHSLMRLNQTVAMQQLTFYYMENDNNSILTHKIDNEIIVRLRTFVDHLKSNYNCQVHQLNINELKYSPELSITKVFSVNDIDGVFENKGKGSFAKLFKYLTCRAPSFILPIMCGILKRILSYLPKSSVLSMDNDLSQLRNKLIEKLGTNGVMLYPCHPTAAGYHGQVFGKFFDYSYMGIYNCLGFPVTNCPIGLNSKGLPISIQVISGYNNDRLTLAVAQEIEKVFGGWIPPPFTKQ